MRRQPNAANGEDTYTTEMTFREAASRSNALQDAELQVLKAQSDNSLLAMLTGRGRARRKHEAQMTKIWYHGQEQELEVILTSRCKAMREQMNHWLRQGGFFLRRETASVALAEVRALDAEVIDYMREIYARARELRAEADEYADEPTIQRRFHGMIEDLLDQSETFVSQLVENFQRMLREKV